MYEGNNSIENRNEKSFAQAQIEIYTADAKKNIEILKKQELADISITESVQQAKKLADVAAERELKRTIVTFSSDGKVFLQKEQFGADIAGELPIKVLSAGIFTHLDDIEERALVITVKKEDDKEIALFWNLNKLEPRWIRLPFEKNGITFGFGEKKENEIRRKFVMAIIGFAKTIPLPDRHGWYYLKETCGYAFPDQITWQEVEKFC